MEHLKIDQQKEINTDHADAPKRKLMNKDTFAWVCL